MIDLVKAQYLINQCPIWFEKEKVSLPESLNKILAEPIIADRDYPPFDRSAMDGIALRIEDFLDNWYSAEIIETIYAGQKSSKILGFKECYKIMTGAVVPLNANAVIPLEKINYLANNKISFEHLPIHGQNIAKKGEDCIENSAILSKNIRISPYIISVLATLGYNEVEVIKSPRIIILSTGNELVDVDRRPDNFQIRASSLYVLQAFFQQLGISTIQTFLLEDDEEKIKQTISNSMKNNDLIITTGGVSAGDTDFIPAVYSSLGFNKYFHKVAIKPGKPIWAGYHSNEKCFAFGMPGNPLSTQICFVLFIQQWIKKWYGLEDNSPLLYPISKEIKQNPKLDIFLPAVLENQNEKVCAMPIKNNGSGDVISTHRMQGFIKIPKGEGKIEENQIVEWWC